MEESSSTTSRKRPKKNLVGGFGNYCCVLGCKSAFYDKNREKTNISLLKELRNYKRKLFLCPPQKQAKTQPTFQNCCFSQ